MKQFPNIILYVLLLLHFPLFYYSNNLIDLSIFSFVELLEITFIVGFIIIMIFFIISKLIRKTTNPIVILISIFLFFSYGIFYELLNDNEIDIKHIYLLPFFVMIFFITLKFSPNITKKTAQILFTILIFLIVSDLLILFSEFDYDETGVYWNFSDDLTNIDLEKFPSIIWIIPDGYPSSNSLQHIASYDNSNFTNNLTNLGFEIKDIHSNYDDTVYSIGSTVNMDYLINTDKQYSMNTEVSNSRLIKLLQTNNYELTHINGAGSYSIEKVDNTLCETNIILKHNEFFKTTMLDFILVLSRPLYTNLTTSHVDNVECSLRELNQLKNMDMKQKFVIAHVMLPHDPYLVKNEFGSLQQLDSSVAPAKGLLGNVKILNNELIKMLPNIIKNNPNTIILIMSDHGAKFSIDKQSQESTEFQKFRHESFLAIYLPNDFKLGDINSNVNIFRSLLQNSSNDVPLLEDKFFHVCHMELQEIYNFENYIMGSKILKENCIKN